MKFAELQCQSGFFLYTSQPLPPRTLGAQKLPLCRLCRGTENSASIHLGGGSPWHLCLLTKLALVVRLVLSSAFLDFGPYWEPIVDLITFVLFQNRFCFYNHHEPDFTLFLQVCSVWFAPVSRIRCNLIFRCPHHSDIQCWLLGSIHLWHPKVELFIIGQQTFQSVRTFFICFVLHKFHPPRLERFQIQTTLKLFFAKLTCSLSSASVFLHLALSASVTN